MEGRISRESLTEGGSYSRPASLENYSSAPRTRNYPRRAGRSAYRSRSYSRRRNASKQGLIPEGRDLFIVQLLASGVLLLFVMFVSVVDTEGTNAMKQKLGTVFSKNVGADEAAEGAALIKDKFSGGVGSVLEIFGGEIEAPEESEGLAEIIDNPRPLPIENTEPAGGEAEIDAETLRQITEYADTPKNR